MQCCLPDPTRFCVCASKSRESLATTATRAATLDGVGTMAPSRHDGVHGAASGQFRSPCGLVYESSTATATTSDRPSAHRQRRVMTSTDHTNAIYPHAAARLHHRESSRRLRLVVGVDKVAVPVRVRVRMPFALRRCNSPGPSPAHRWTNASTAARLGAIATFGVESDALEAFGACQ